MGGLGGVQGTAVQSVSGKLLCMHRSLGPGPKVKILILDIRMLCLTCLNVHLFYILQGLQCIGKHKLLLNWLWKHPLLCFHRGIGNCLIVILPQSC